MAARQFHADVTGLVWIMGFAVFCISLSVFQHIPTALSGLITFTRK